MATVLLLGQTVLVNRREGAGEEVPDPREDGQDSRIQTGGGELDGCREAKCRGRGPRFWETAREGTVL